MPHQPKAMPSTVVKALARLSRAEQLAAAGKVLEHIRACERMGFRAENEERAWIEAIELTVKGDLDEGAWVDYEPVRRYGQYQTPVDKGMS